MHLHDSRWLRITSTVAKSAMPAPLARLAVLLVLLCGSGLAQTAGSRPPLPYRFLLIISSQWKDPASYLIEGEGEFPVTASSY
jgi:hypothetical protein